MKNIELWCQTKFILGDDGWEPTRDPKQLSPVSRHTSGRALKAYVAALQAHANGHLLDLGCGQAPLYGAYSEFVTQVTCVDWPGSPHNTHHVDIFADLNEALPLESEAYDTILSTSVLEHIWRHDLLWREMQRVLRPGGRLILGTPFMYWLHEQPHDFFRWTHHALRRAAEESGLEVLEVSPFGSGLDVLTDVCVKIAAKRSRRIAGAVHAIASRLLRLRSVRAFSDKRAAEMPLGHVLVARKP